MFSIARTTYRSTDAGPGQEAPLSALEERLVPRPPSPRSIQRDRLLGRLRDTDAPVIGVVAPAGYGKTTLLALWAGSAERRCAWLTLDDADDDPDVLLHDAHEAVVRAAGTGAPTRTRRRGDASALARAMSAAGPLCLILDRVDVITDRRSLDVLAQLSLRVPEGSTLVLASRVALPIPASRLQAEQRFMLLEVRDLMLDEAETRELLRDLGIRLEPAAIGTLTGRTRGWAAAVHLAADWLGMDERHEVAALAGDTQPIADYLRTEILDGWPRKDVRFMMRTSILDRMSGSLCDAALEGANSWKTLERLGRSNVPIEHADDHETWYRYHPLVRDLLRAELERHEPGVMMELLPRAAAWCEEHGEPVEAVRYAQATGDVDRVLRLATAHAQPLFAAGRGELVADWFEWLRTRLPDERLGPVALLAVISHAMLGNPAEADRWLETLQRAKPSRQDELPDGSRALEPWLTLLRSLLCRDGVERMAADAERALVGLPPGSWFRTIGLLEVGVARMLTGETAEADDALSDAEEQTQRFGAHNAAVVASSERALIAIRTSDRDAATGLSRRASAIRDEHALGAYATSALSYAVSARIALWTADLPTARRELAKAHRLRPRLTYALPWLAVQTLLEMVHVQIGLADSPGAKVLIREIDAILRRRPNLGTLPSEVAEVRKQVETIRSDTPGASTLTSAELRLLPLLRTHHPFREIAEQLFVSKHTVKTQAISIYRKLGVTSRSEAVARAVDLGLLDP